MHRRGKSQSFEVLLLHFRFLERKLSKELQCAAATMHRRGNPKRLKFFLLLFLSRKRRREKGG
jgi:hypothetical protein